MAVTNVTYRAFNKRVVLQAAGVPLLPEYVSIGTYEHPDDEDVLGPSPSHVLYQHVQELLYQQDEQDMQSVLILQDIPVESIAVSPVNPSIAVAATVQLSVAFTPNTALNHGVTYSSGTPAHATVDASGLVTGVAAGTSVITATSVSGSKVSTTTVTVTA